MTKNTKNTKPVKAATLAVDYTPEQSAALVEVRKAATAFKAWSGRGDGSLLLQCVEATRHAVESGLLVDARTSEPAPGTMGKGKFADLFAQPDHPAPVSEVGYWVRLASALAAGVVVGDDTWQALASGARSSLGGSKRLAKDKNVGKVIDDGGSAEQILTACQQAVAESDRRKAAGRKARPASEKPATGDKPADGIPVTDDPIADAMLAVLALGAAFKRIPVEDREGYAKVRKALASVARRESTLRRLPAETVKAA